MEANTKRLTQVLGALGIAAGLGLGAAGIAAAATDTTSTPASSEASALQATAKVTPAAAGQAALAALPGTVNEVELDNENGTVVYSVEVADHGTTTDVKVDPGTGKVLAQESSEDGKPEAAGEIG
jgi:uncharacterized membrane protein YkoI